MEGGVEDVEEEVSVLEEAEDGEVGHHAESTQRLAAMTETVHADAEEPAQQGGADKQQHEEAGGLVIEQQAECEEIAVAQHTAAGFQAAVGLTPLARHEEAEHHVHEKEQHPEMNLGEQQRLVAVEREEA